MLHFPGELLLSLSGARTSRPEQDFLGPPSVSAKVEHCGLVLEGPALLLDGLFAKLSAEVDSRGLALEECVVVLPWGM